MVEKIIGSLERLPISFFQLALKAGYAYLFFLRLLVAFFFLFFVAFFLRLAISTSPFSPMIVCS